MPSGAHRKRESAIVDVALADVVVGDTLVIFLHDICPVDGVVIEGHGVMDESYLMGEPFQITKTSGSTVRDAAGGPCGRLASQTSIRQLVPSLVLFRGQIRLYEFYEGAEYRPLDRCLIG
jgi:high-affinity K+ transport system ATPase subunit B